MLNADRGVDEELWLAGMEACRAIVESGLAGELRRPEIRLNVGIARRGGREGGEGVLLCCLP